MQSPKRAETTEGASVADVEKSAVARIGEALRQKIRDHKGQTGRSYRHLSEAIGRDANYVASYLSKDPKDWAIPKHPTYQKLLSELGVTEDDLSGADGGAADV